jgi:hypothetical protein
MFENLPAKDDPKEILKLLTSRAEVGEVRVFKEEKIV